MKSKILLLFLSISLVFIMTACDDSDSKSVKNTAWADSYAELISSGKSIDHDNFENLQKKLDSIRKESGATYVYVIMPIKDKEASMKGDPNGDFMLTIDGSEEPEDWGVVYDAEVQFAEAWNGEVSAARSAWSDGDEACWSAFAPVYDEDGNVVCLLGIDYPATDVTEKYPEWNRDNAGWNGFTDEITGDIPQEIQEKINTIKTIVEKHAKELSTKSK